MTAVPFTDVKNLHSVITCSLGRMVALVQLNKELDGDLTCKYCANKRICCDAKESLVTIEY